MSQAAYLENQKRLASAVRYSQLSTRLAARGNHKKSALAARHALRVRCQMSGSSTYPIIDDQFWSYTSETGHEYTAISALVPYYIDGLYRCERFVIYAAHSGFNTGKVKRSLLKAMYTLAKVFDAQRKLPVDQAMAGILRTMAQSDGQPVLCSGFFAAGDVAKAAADSILVYNGVLINKNHVPIGCYFNITTVKISMWREFGQ